MKMKPETEFLIFVLAGSFIVFALYIFVVGPIPEKNRMLLLYFGYAICVIYVTHVLGFAAVRLFNQMSLASKNIPKYIDYLYASVFAIGVFQVFFAAPQIHDYVVYKAGDEKLLEHKIRKNAFKHLRDDCGKKSRRLFPQDFCEILRTITVTPNLIAYARDDLYKNDRFMNQEIEVITVPRGRITRLSPVAWDIRHLYALYAYRSNSADHQGNAFRWVALLLVPFALGFRLTKTSLELFAPLK